MKVFLDDARTPPEGWQIVPWPDEAIALLKMNTVTDLSLDHDLGDGQRGTGYDVLIWIEEAVALADFKPPLMTIHSANPAARLRMDAAVRSIRRAAEAIRSRRTENATHTLTHRSPGRFNLVAHGAQPSAFRRPLSLRKGSSALGRTAPVNTGIKASFSARASGFPDADRNVQLAASWLWAGKHRGRAAKAKQGALTKTTEVTRGAAVSNPPTAS